MESRILAQERQAEWYNGTFCQVWMKVALNRVRLMFLSNFMLEGNILIRAQDQLFLYLSSWLPLFHFFTGKPRQHHRIEQHPLNARHGCHNVWPSHKLRIQLAILKFGSQSPLGYMLLQTIVLQMKAAWKGWAMPQLAASWQRMLRIATGHLGGGRFGLSVVFPAQINSFGGHSSVWLTARSNLRRHSAPEPSLHIYISDWNARTSGGLWEAFAVHCPLYRALYRLPSLGGAAQEVPQCDIKRGWRRNPRRAILPSSKSDIRISSLGNHLCSNVDHAIYPGRSSLFFKDNSDLIEA